MEKLNNGLQRVQEKRDKEVPIENNSSLWFMWYDEEGTWDAELITRHTEIVDRLSVGSKKTIFCVWHGNYRTNLFLMDQHKLIKRLKKLNGK